MNSKPSIHLLQKNELDDFFPPSLTFSLRNLPSTKKNIVRYLLDKIYSLDNYKYWLENNLKTILVARENDTIIGFAVIDEPYGGVSSADGWE